MEQHKAAPGEVTNYATYEATDGDSGDGGAEREAGP